MKTTKELLKLNYKELREKANKLRKIHSKNKVYTCSIINAKSGKCSENCTFCAQSSHYKVEVPVYNLVSEEKIFEAAKENNLRGATQFSIVTSGYKVNSEELEKICKVAERIKENFPEMSLCASLGNLSFTEMKKLKKSGISRYHHNLETAESYFSEICTTHDYDLDIQTIQLAQKAGLKVCAGGIIGLGENWEQRIELAEKLKELQVDNIPMNFLNPIKGTKLENKKIISTEDALKTIAIFRIINPEINIGVCGGREIALKDKQDELFIAGANGLMFGNYLTTSGRKIEEDQKMIKKLELSCEKI